MSDNTKIEWTDATWNPIRGCSRVSEGCRHCYAETVAKRFSGEGQPYEGLIARGGQWNGQIKIVDHVMDQPLRWQRPRLVFVNSMSDLFHENVPEHVVDRVFSVMALAEKHTFQVLTKRPERMLQYLSQDRRRQWADMAVHFWGGIDPDALHDSIHYGDQVLPNVWLGVSVEDQKSADERIPLLLATPAAVRWISAEPLLGPVDLSCWPIYGPDREQLLNWVVVGGESGANARPMHPDWARSLRDQCADAGVPFLFKQWGEWAPRDFPAWPENADYLDSIGKGWWCPETRVWMERVGKRSAGRLLDGVQHDGYPATQDPALNLASTCTEDYQQ